MRKYVDLRDSVGLQTYFKVQTYFCWVALRLRSADGRTSKSITASFWRLSCKEQNGITSCGAFYKTLSRLQEYCPIWNLQRSPSYRRNPQANYTRVSVGLLNLLSIVCLTELLQIIALLKQRGQKKTRESTGGGDQTQL